MLDSTKTLLYLSGRPVSIQNCNIIVTPPSIEDIALYGEDNFFIGLQLITNFKEVANQIREGNYELAYMSDFQLLLELLNMGKETEVLLIRFLKFVMPDYKIKLTSDSLDFYIQQEDNSIRVGRLLDDSFPIFSQVFNELFLPQIGKKEEEEYNPANDLAAQIAEKLKAGRQKVLENKQNEKDEGSLFGSFASILSIGLSMDLNTIMKYTPFQLFDALNRFWSKTENDFYQRIATMPFMDVSKIDAPEDWYRNLYL